MGILGKLFDKKICDICGGEIGLLGNKKLENGNLCKECASKLSPWFSERRHSTVDQIAEQLRLREENKEAVSEFNTTLSFGESTKLLLDEEKKCFMVTSARNLQEANPDVISLSQVTGCDSDISHYRSELKKKDEEGKYVSYNPPRYEYHYTFCIVIRLNHPYIDDIRFRLNNSDLKIEPPSGVGLFGQSAVTDPEGYARSTPEYKKYETQCSQIADILMQGRLRESDGTADNS